MRSTHERKDILAALKDLTRSLDSLAEVLGARDEAVNPMGEEAPKAATGARTHVRAREDRKNLPERMEDAPVGTTKAVSNLNSERAYVKNADDLWYWENWADGKDFWYGFTPRDFTDGVYRLEYPCGLTTIL